MNESITIVKDILMDLEKQHSEVKDKLLLLDGAIQSTKIIIEQLEFKDLPVTTDPIINDSVNINTEDNKPKRKRSK